jgi:hypothetical protein
MDVALKAILKQGVDSLNLRTLATRAGVSSGAPYHHFGSREGLLAALATEGVELLGAALLRERDAAAATASARLKALGKAYVQFALTHTGHFKVMFRGELQGAVGSALSAEGERAFGLLREAVVQCQLAGQAPAGDPAPLVLYAWTTVHGLASLMVEGSLKKIPLPAEQLPTVVTDLTERMFEALASTPAC